MKLLLTLAALAATITIGYIALGEWLDNADTTWLDEAHGDQDDSGEFNAHLPHPWSKVS